MLGLGRLRRYLHDWKVEQIHRAHRLEYVDDYQRFDAILEKFRTGGGLKHDYQAYKLFSLWQLLLAEKPSRILELGTGSSTAMFADFVRLHGGYLCSVDESKEWLDNSRKLAAIDTDDTRFNLKQANRRVIYKSEQPVEFGYDVEFEDEPFDLVLVDGPSMRVDGKRYKQAVNPDIFELIERAPPQMILVDIRAATAEVMKQRLADTYSYQISDIIQGDIKRNYRYFSEFRLRT